MKFVGKRSKFTESGMQATLTAIVVTLRRIPGSQVAHAVPDLSKYMCPGQIQIRSSREEHEQIGVSDITIALSSFAFLSTNTTGDAARRQSCSRDGREEA